MNPEDYTALILLIAMIVIAVFVGIYQSRRRKEMLMAQADKRGGEVVKTSLLGRTELRLPYQGNTIAIYSVPGSRYSPPRTLATVRLENPLLPDIQVLRNSLTQKLLGSFGRERILTGDAEFDKRFAILSEDTFLAQKVLTQDIRERFLDPVLRAMELKVSPQYAQITTLFIPRDDAAYDNFIDTALAIFQKIL